MSEFKTSSAILPGRGKLLGSLADRLLGGRPGTAIAVHGPPGIGKTALVRALVQEPPVREHFRDRILWAGLGRRPEMDVHQASWAKRLGAPLPKAKEGWIQALNHEIGNRRMLLVIDDAWEFNDAILLKVGGPQCAYVLTTQRSELALEFAGEGMLRLRGLDTAAGVDLLALIAPQATRQAPDESRKLVETVEGSPLALTLLAKSQLQGAGGQDHNPVAAALAALQEEMGAPRGTPTEQAEKTTGQQARVLTPLDAAIRTGFGQLDETLQSALSQASVFAPDPNSFSTAAAHAVLSGGTEALTGLIRLGWIQPVSSDRFSMHSSVCEFIRQRGRQIQTAESLVEYVLHAAEAGILAAGEPEQEFTNMMTAVAYAVELEFADSVLRAGPVLSPYFERLGKREIAEYLLEEGREIALIRDDFPALARILQHLGENKLMGGENEAAISYLQESLVLAEVEQLAEVEPWALLLLGQALHNLQNLSTARQHTAAALRLFREQGEYRGQIQARYTAGRIAVELEEPEQARDHFITVITLAREIDSQEDERQALIELGHLARRQQNLPEARTWYRRGLRMARETHSRYDEAALLEILGDLAIQERDFDEARTHLEAARLIRREDGDERLETACISRLCDVCLESGDYSNALAHARKLLAIMRENLDPAGEAEVLRKFGRIFLEIGKNESAAGHFRQAQDIYREQNDLMGEAGCLQGIAQVAYARKEYEQALEVVRQSVQMRARAGQAAARADGHILAGRILLQMNALERAEHEFQLAGEQDSETGEAAASFESLAGLVQVALRRDQPGDARAFAEGLLTFLQTEPEQAGDLPAWVMVTLYEAVSAWDPEKAAALLEQAHERLQEKAARISNQAFQRSFLENVPDNRDLQRARSRSQG